MTRTLNDPASISVDGQPPKYGRAGQGSRPLLRFLCAVLLTVLTAVTVSACGTEASSPDFCESVQDLANLQKEASDSSSSPEVFGDFVRRMTTVTDTMAASAPDEVKADTEQLSESMHQIDGVLASANYDMSQLSPQERETLNESTFAEAANAVIGYAKTECGIDIGPRGADQTGDNGQNPASSQPVDPGPAPQEGEAPSQ